MPTDLMSQRASVMSSGGSPIRVGFVLHVMQVAGAEVLVAEIIRRLGARLAPVVFCLDGVGQLGERMQAEGVPVVALGRRPGLDMAVAGRLAREIRARHLEVLHAHQYTPFFYSALARLRARRPVHLMFTEHGRHYPDIVSTRRRVVNRLFLSHLADEINGVCGFSARSLAHVDGFAGRPIEVIENGIDLVHYAASTDRGSLRAALGLDPARRYLICVARFHPVKDHRMLLTAFAKVAAARHDVDLLLAGDGPLRADLEGRAQTLGIAERVRFLGIRDDVPRLLEAADVFTLTSVSEAASITLLEAMACGLPVVVTDVGGNPDIVRQGVDGILVPRGDGEAAASAIATLLDDRARARAMGQAGRIRVQERYQLASTVEKYYQRYQAAAERLRPRTLEPVA
jgi:glycosyltransferase involved in cell wall biosynthesis